MPFGNNKTTGKPGPSPKAPRNGDKRQARQRINVEVRTGYRPHPNSIPCHVCGHMGDDRRHEYHHHKGYDAANHYDVIPLCTLCHAKADGVVTECLRGHSYTPENTIIKPNGTKQCRECTRMRDRGRRDAAFWREYRKSRKERSRG